MKHWQTLSQERERTCAAPIEWDPGNDWYLVCIRVTPYFCDCLSHDRHENVGRSELPCGSCRSTMQFVRNVHCMCGWLAPSHWSVDVMQFVRSYSIQYGFFICIYIYKYVFIFEFVYVCILHIYLFKNIFIYIYWPVTVGSFFGVESCGVLVLVVLLWKKPFHTQRSYCTTRTVKQCNPLLLYQFPHIHNWRVQKDQIFILLLTMTILYMCSPRDTIKLDNKKTMW
jgi:hypothetical protein